MADLDGLIGRLVMHNLLHMLEHEEDVLPEDPLYQQVCQAYVTTSLPDQRLPIEGE